MIVKRKKKLKGLKKDQAYTESNILKIHVSRSVTRFYKLSLLSSLYKIRHSTHLATNNLVLCLVLKYTTKKNNKFDV